ncbi:WD40 repeat-like protein [Lichtheimia hyalospora FSU 10163]|nr:WD40 repeat-like protein [Lichtheimia hyalospora FSU 10163]
MDSNPSNEHGSAIWAMNFSPDGKYMAAVGQDHVIKIWKVHGDSQHSHRTNKDIREEHMSINVFDEEPVKEFTGHTDDVLALRWSKNHFLLSASLDNTVMLWHVSVNECLCLFQHVDYVTGVAFHPMDDRYFVSGSTDGKIRIWNIPKKCVVSWASSPDKSVITAVGFTPDGKTVCAGSTNGQLLLYDTEKLKYLSKMELKRRHAKRGRKITGIEMMPRTTEPVVLAALSDDGQYIACGSDKHTVHIWGTYSPSSDREQNLKSNSNVNLAENTLGRNSDHLHDDTHSKLNNGRLSHWLHSGDQQWQERLYNHERYFTAGRGLVTRVIFAPTAARQQLAISGTDMIYNHTPIMYVHHDASKPSSKDNPNIRVSHHMPRVEKDSFENQEELLERAKYDYTDGHILVTASDKGEIKVWRFDSGVYPGMSSGITGLSDMFRPSRRASFANGTLAPDHHHRPASGSFSSVGTRPSFRALRRASRK